MTRIIIDTDGSLGLFSALTLTIIMLIFHWWGIANQYSQYFLTGLHENAIKDISTDAAGYFV